MTRCDWCGRPMTAPGLLCAICSTLEDKTTLRQDRSSDLYEASPNPHIRPHHWDARLRKPRRLGLSDWSQQGWWAQRGADTRPSVRASLPFRLDDEPLDDVLERIAPTPELSRAFRALDLALAHPAKYALEETE